MRRRRISGADVADVAGQIVMPSALNICPNATDAQISREHRLVLCESQSDVFTI